jgi:tripartite-type tricarboxylate transporter receptor subunit TctC
MQPAKRLAAALAAVFVTIAQGALVQGAHAQGYPSKPIRIVAPYPPGGAADITSRIVGKRLAEELGQPVLVENKPGAGGGVGTQFVARSAPDGYTLLLSNPGPASVNPVLFKDVGYHPENDFQPIGVVITAPLFVVVPASSPIRNMKDLVELGKSKKDANLNFGSSGIGALSHLGGELLNIAAGTQFQHVPYKGAAPLGLALLSGEVQWSFLPGPDAFPQIRAGKLRPLAVAGATRTPLSPDTPTLIESGMPGFGVTLWYGLLAPAKTPRPVVDVLHRTLTKIMAEPEMKAKFLELSAEPNVSTPEGLAAIIKAELAQYTRAVKASGAKAE